MVVKNSPAKAEDARGDQKDPLEEMALNPLQYAWLENPMDRGAWWAIIHGVAKSQTWQSMQTYIDTRYYTKP